MCVCTKKSKKYQTKTQTVQCFMSRDDDVDDDEDWVRFC